MIPQGAGLGSLRWLKVAGEVAGSKEGVDWTQRRTKVPIYIPTYLPTYLPT